MMKTSSPVKTYDSIEYGILLPDAVVQHPSNYEKKKRMSWPKCLCLTLLVLVVALILTGAVGALWGYCWMKHQVKRFTTDKAVKFPIHEIPQAELEILKDRAKLFYDTIRAGQTPAQDFVISEDEINGLVAQSDYLRGNALVHLVENNFGADVSLPAKFLPGGKGRYFVGSGSVTTEQVMKTTEQTKITTEFETHYKIDGLQYPNLLFGEFVAYAATDGTKTVNLLSGQFYNWVAPDDCIAKEENILEHLCDDDDDQDCRDLVTFLNGIADITIENQKITIHADSLDNDGSRRRHLASTTNSASSVKKARSYGSYARRSLAKMIF